ncbi:MAG TPA: orc1/cdc6 family replication initiation protein [Candidatus Acidoferrales bacterium]|nr:orc1/cdc6 family replication initiation protein [Candidatus Acidoferrales bacterium]
MNNTDILDELFESFASNATIFRDREVLRHDYLPGRLPHREGQIRQLGEIVAPLLKGARSSNIFIYGNTGTGKTAVVKYVLTRLEFKAKEFNAPVKFCYVNCRVAGSEYRVFASMCQSLGVQVPFTGLSVGEVYDRFIASLDLSSMIFLVVLDEADALTKMRGDTFLYELTRMNEVLKHSKIALVGISNDLRFKEFLDPRVLSSLSEEEIVFRPYDAGELRNILAERAQTAFTDKALSDAALGLCAALAAAEHGDARRALDLLRVAGEVAERKGLTTVSEEHVREAEKHIEHNRVVEALSNLPLHSKLVTLSIYHLGKRDARGAITGEISEVYDELSGELGVAPLTQRRLSTLINELDAMGLLNARVVSMGRYGRTKKIRLEIARSLIRSVFAEDSRLGRLVDYEVRCISKCSNGKS